MASVTEDNVRQREEQGQRLQKQRHKKLAALPRDYKVTKRPLLRAPVASKYSASSTEKIVYVSTKMPFMAGVKKIQKLLEQVERRETRSARTTMQKQKLRSGGRSKEAHDNAEQIAAMMAKNGVAGGHEFNWGEVVIKATGKAIDKALGMGLWFQQRDEYKIHIKTSSVGAIDDIGPCAANIDAVTTDTMKGDLDASIDLKELDNVAIAQPVEVPESRIRQASVIEIYVSHKT